MKRYCKTDKEGVLLSAPAHVFARMKHMGVDICRSIGLKRAAQHSHLANLVYNMDRYVCLVR